jgi:chromosome segregation ATPase
VADVADMEHVVHAQVDAMRQRISEQEQQLISCRKSIARLGNLHAENSEDVAADEAGAADLTSAVERRLQQQWNDLHEQLAAKSYRCAELEEAVRCAEAQCKALAHDVDAERRRRAAEVSKVDSMFCQLRSLEAREHDLQLSSGSMQEEMNGYRLALLRIGQACGCASSLPGTDGSAIPDQDPSDGFGNLEQAILDKVQHSQTETMQLERSLAEWKERGKRLTCEITSIEATAERLGAHHGCTKRMLGAGRTVDLLESVLTQSIRTSDELSSLQGRLASVTAELAHVEQQYHAKCKELKDLADGHASMIEELTGMQHSLADKSRQLVGMQGKDKENFSTLQRIVDESTPTIAKLMQGIHDSAIDTTPDQIKLGRADVKGIIRRRLDFVDSEGTAEPDENVARDALDCVYTLSIMSTSLRQKLQNEEELHSEAVGRSKKLQAELELLRAKHTQAEMSQHEVQQEWSFTKMQLAEREAELCELRNLVSQRTSEQSESRQKVAQQAETMRRIRDATWKLEKLTVQFKLSDEEIAKADSDSASAADRIESCTAALRKQLLDLSARLSEEETAHAELRFRLNLADEVLKGQRHEFEGTSAQLEALHTELKHMHAVALQVQHELQVVLPESPLTGRDKWTMWSTTIIKEIRLQHEAFQVGLHLPCTWYNPTFHAARTLLSSHRVRCSTAGQQTRAVFERRSHTQVRRGRREARALDRIHRSEAPHAGRSVRS